MDDALDVARILWTVGEHLEHNQVLRRPGAQSNVRWKGKEAGKAVDCCRDIVRCTGASDSAHIAPAPARGRLTWSEGPALRADVARSRSARSRRKSRASRTGVATSAPADRRLCRSVRDRPSRDRRRRAPRQYRPRAARAPRRTEREVAETHPFIVGADALIRSTRAISPSSERASRTDRQRCHHRRLVWRFTLQGACRGATACSCDAREL